jgi:dihydrofolate reductase
MSGEGLENTSVISDHLAENINQTKNLEGKNILIFGSPRASHSLLNAGLVDEFWLFMNPILLGEGIPLFKNVPEITKLNLVETKTFACGVVAMHYAKIK